MLDYDKRKKILDKIYAEGELYNFPNMEYAEIDNEDILDLSIILMIDKDGSCVLNRTDRKILIQAIADRYKGITTSKEKEKRLQSPLAKDLFSKILQRQQNGFPKGFLGSGVRMKFFS